MHQELYHRLIQYCKERLPEEACGFIFGRIERNGWTATTILPIPNIANHPQYEFLMEPTHVIDALFHPQDSAQWIGIFHSHPTGATHLSEMDLRTYWDIVPTHWIIGLKNAMQPEVAGYQIHKSSGCIECITFSIV